MGSPARLPVNSKAHTPLLWCPFSSDRHFKVWTSHTWTAGSRPTCTSHTHTQPIRALSGRQQEEVADVRVGDGGVGGGDAHLRGSCVVFERVHSQAEDVVVVAEVEPLAVLQPVVDDGHGGHVVHNLPSLSVEQVVATVEAPVPAGSTSVWCQRSQDHRGRYEGRPERSSLTREQTADEVPPLGLSAVSGNQLAFSAAEGGPPYTPGGGIGKGREGQTDRQMDRWTGWFQQQPLT